MAQLYIKANELEEKDTVKVFNERGKEVYYTKDDFIATGHRIKIYMADTITEVAYVQEKYDGDIVRFEFCARDKFGTIERDFFTLAQNYNIDFDEDWEIVGDAFAPRNPYALNIDYREAPPMYDVGGQHRIHVPQRALLLPGLGQGPGANFRQRHA